MTPTTEQLCSRWWTIRKLELEMTGRELERCDITPDDAMTILHEQRTAQPRVWWPADAELEGEPADIVAKAVRDNGGVIGTLFGVPLVVTDEAVPL